jgi:hypothetical protein
MLRAQVGFGMKTEHVKSGKAVESQLRHFVSGRWYVIRRRTNQKAVFVQPAFWRRPRSKAPSAGEGRGNKQLVASPNHLPY